LPIPHLDEEVYELAVVGAEKIAQLTHADGETGHNFRLRIAGQLYTFLCFCQGVQQSLPSKALWAEADPFDVLEEIKSLADRSGLLGRPGRPN